MNVRLIAYTQPTPEFRAESGAENIQDLIAYMARVSNPGNQLNFETANGLIKYLMKHAHWSPFEMCHATMEITTTRDIARQILRHRSASFQEFSQRYADPTQDLGFVIREARLQDHKNRQNSIEIDDEVLHHDWENQQTLVHAAAQRAYRWAIENGIAKEQARAVLPEGLTISKMYMTNNIRGWIHYCALRMGPETQKEHREIALACANELVKIATIFKDL